MNAARLTDVGDERMRDMYVDWIVEGTECQVCYRVHYHVDYPSIVHRGRGMGAQAVVTRIEVEIDGELKPAQLNRAQREALGAQLESEDELSAPLAGD